MSLHCRSNAFTPPHIPTHTHSDTQTPGHIFHCSVAELCKTNRNRRRERKCQENRKYCFSLKAKTEKWNRNSNNSNKTMACIHCVTMDESKPTTTATTTQIATTKYYNSNNAKQLMLNNDKPTSSYISFHSAVVCRLVCNEEICMCVCVCCIYSRVRIISIAVVKQ